MVKALIGSKGRVLGTLPFLFISFGNYRLPGHPAIAEQ